MIDTVITPLLQIAVVLNAVLVLVTIMPLLERKVQGWVQSRLGPMRVGPWGLLQAIVDPIKLLLKEDITPTKADKWMFTLAPILAMVPALVVFSVVPFGGDELFYITDINVGLLFVIAVTSIGVYGIILAGWASNSKYPLLASLRAAAQLISYEIAISMTLVSVILTAGTLSMVGIVEAQQVYLSATPGEESGLWFVFVQPVAFVLVLIGGLAENNRVPFDLPEAEQELTGGFHTEYSGMRWALFFLAEYANMIVIAAVLTTLFWGGWLRPFPNVEALAFLDFIPSVLLLGLDRVLGLDTGWVWFLGKMGVFLYLSVWIRATFPRYRYDQLMRLGWKVLIPIAIANIVVTAVVKVLL